MPAFYFVFVRLRIDNIGQFGGCLDRQDAFIARVCRIIHLACANHLAIGCLQVEIELMIDSQLSIKAMIEVTVVLHSLYAMFASLFTVVRLAAQNNLVVVGLQYKMVMRVVGCGDHKFSHTRKG